MNYLAVLELVVHGRSEQKAKDRGAIQAPKAEGQVGGPGGPAIPGTPPRRRAPLCWIPFRHLTCGTALMLLLLITDP